MMAISLGYLVACSLVVSTVLLWVNLHGLGTLGAAGAAAMACIAIPLVQSLAAGAVPLSKQGWQAWTLFLFAPSAVLFLASRIGFLRATPWMLLLVGPITFIVAATAVMIGYNILLAGRHRL